MSTRGLIVDRPTAICDWHILPIADTQNGYRIKVTLRHLTDAEDIAEGQLKHNIISATTMKSQEHESKEAIIYAKYVIGCDGAHSWVRKKLGFTMDGEQTGKCLY